MYQFERSCHRPDRMSKIAQAIGVFIKRTKNLANASATLRSSSPLTEPTFRPRIQILVCPENVQCSEALGCILPTILPYYRPSQSAYSSASCPNNTVSIRSQAVADHGQMQRAPVIYLGVSFQQDRDLDSHQVLEHVSKIKPPTPRLSKLRF